MKFYSFEEINAAGDCALFAADVFGARLAAGRCNAAWRGGDHPSIVSITKNQWHDFKMEEGGGIIQLAAYRFDGDETQAQQFLGEYYNLNAKMETGKAPREGAPRISRMG